MVSPVSLYSPTNGRRYSRAFPAVPYLGYSERHNTRSHTHSPSSSHDHRPVTMTDQQLDSDTAPQRKRIAVACGRCRKRKIRCSGDPGAGQPCSNCKNAGVEECLFLRVQSREAPMRVEPADFYSVGDARIYASRAAVSSSLPYHHELPNLGSPDVVTSYRSSSAYPPYPGSKPYYAAAHYATPFPEEFDYGMAVPSPQPVLPQDACVGPLMPSHWGSPRPKPPPSAEPGYGNMLLTTDPSPYAYGGSHATYRPPPVSSGSNNFSFSGVAASLPDGSGLERLLPNPIARASTQPPYPGGAVKSLAPPPPPAATGSAHPTTLADVASVASYATTGSHSGYHDATGLSYGPSASHHPTPSRTMSSDRYSGGGESIFGQESRDLQTQGELEFGMTYTTEGRRESTSSGRHSSSHAMVSLSNESTQKVSKQFWQQHAEHQHPGVHTTVAGYAVTEPPTTPSSPHPLHGQNGPGPRHQEHQVNHQDHRATAITECSGSSSTSHADSHQR